MRVSNVVLVSCLLLMLTWCQDSSNATIPATQNIQGSQGNITVGTNVTTQGTQAVNSDSSNSTPAASTASQSVVQGPNATNGLAQPDNGSSASSSNNTSGIQASPIPSNNLLDNSPNQIIPPQTIGDQTSTQQDNANSVADSGAASSNTPDSQQPDASNQDINPLASSISGVFNNNWNQNWSDVPDSTNYVAIGDNGNYVPANGDASSSGDSSIDSSSAAGDNSQAASQAAPDSTFTNVDRSTSPSQIDATTQAQTQTQTQAQTQAVPTSNDPSASIQNPLPVQNSGGVSASADSQQVSQQALPVSANVVLPPQTISSQISAGSSQNSNQSNTQSSLVDQSAVQPAIQPTASTDILISTVTQSPIQGLNSNVVLPDSNVVPSSPQTSSQPISNDGTSSLSSQSQSQLSSVPAQASSSSSTLSAIPLQPNILPPTSTAGSTDASTQGALNSVQTQSSSSSVNHTPASLLANLPVNLPQQSTVDSASQSTLVIFPPIAPPTSAQADTELILVHRDESEEKEGEEVNLTGGSSFQPAFYSAKTHELWPFRLFISNRPRLNMGPFLIAEPTDSIDPTTQASTPNLRTDTVNPTTTNNGN